jgi:hypothetical protein
MHSTQRNSADSLCNASVAMHPTPSRASLVSKGALVTQHARMDSICGPVVAGSDGLNLGPVSHRRDDLCAVGPPYAAGRDLSSWAASATRCPRNHLWRDPCGDPAINRIRTASLACESGQPAICEPCVIAVRVSGSRADQRPFRSEAGFVKPSHRGKVPLGFRNSVGLLASSTAKSVTDPFG